MLPLLISLLIAPALAGETYYYNGPDGTNGQLSAEQIAEKVAADPGGKHLVWQPGWAEWLEASAVEGLAPASPAASAQTWTYAGPSGQHEGQTAQQIADRITANPGGQHLVWQAGWSDWKDVSQVEAISALIPSPPPIPASAPPLPTAGATPEAPPPPEAQPASAPPLTPSDVPSTSGAESAGVVAPPRIATSPILAPQASAPPAPDTPAVTSAAPMPLPGDEGGPAISPLRPMLELSGEIRLDAGVADLTDAMTPNVALSRARLRADAALTDALSARVELDVYEVGSGAYYDPDVTVAAGDPNALGANASEAWIRAEGEMGALTLGRQASAFGTRDWYNDHGAYYQAGAVMGLDLGRRTGLVQHQVSAIGGALTPSEAVRVDAQVSGNPGDNVELTGRAAISPMENIDVYLSGLYSVDDTPSDRFMYSAAGNLDLGAFRIMGEFLNGRYMEADDFLGYQVAAAYDAAVEAGALQQVTLVGAYMGYDPVIGNDYPDAWIAAGGGPQLYWATRGDRVLATGLTYQVTVPQNIEEPLVHDAALQVSATF